MYTKIWQILRGLEIPCITPICRRLLTVPSREENDRVRPFCSAHNYSRSYLDLLNKKMIVPDSRHDVRGLSHNFKIALIDCYLRLSFSPRLTFVRLLVINRSPLTLYGHIITAQQRTIIQQCGDWYTGG